MAEIKLPSGAKIITFPPRPEGFDPLQADDETLIRYGFPSRAAVPPAMLSHWKDLVQRKMTYIEPQFRRSDHKRHGLRQRAASDSSATSPNWSGDVVFASAGSRFTFAQGTWSVPTVKAPAADGNFYYCSSWVGIDGDGSPDVFQTGTECEVETSGGATNTRIYPWWEWYPENEVEITSLLIAAGHIVFCYVYVQSNTSGIVAFSNYTTGKTTNFQVTAPSGTSLVGNCAEWIVERPGIGGATSNLANYGDVIFLQARTQAYDGHVYTHPLANAGIALDMTDGSGNVLSRGAIVDESTVKCDYAGP